MSLARPTDYYPFWI